MFNNNLRTLGQREQCNSGQHWWWNPDTEVNSDWSPWSAPYDGGIEVGPAKLLPGLPAPRGTDDACTKGGDGTVVSALHLNRES